MKTTDCLDDRQLDGYLNRGAGEPDGDGAEEHLSRCRWCRKRLVERYERRVDEQVDHRVAPELMQAVLRLPERRERRRVPMPWKLRTLAAAAALVAVVLTGVLVRLRKPPRDDGDPVRAQPSVARGPKLLAPIPDAIVTVAALDLRWMTVPGASRYTVVLLDEKGDPILRRHTEALHLAVDVPLTPDKTYYWYVSVASRHGPPRDSEIRSFRTALRGDGLGQSKRPPFSLHGGRSSREP